MTSQENSKRDAVDNVVGGSLERHPTKRAKIANKLLHHDDYVIGWVCALPLELTAAKAVLDEQHPSLSNSPGDDNVYCLGSIHCHNVVITCLPSGLYGNNRSAVVAERMRHTFPNITASLIVGIGGGVPSSVHDIRLGDVVVSLPRSDFPAVVQYDFGKTEAHGISHSKSSLNKPPTSLLKAVSSLQSEHQMGRNQMQIYIREAIKNHHLPAFTYPGTSRDVLYETECNHWEEGLTCTICGPIKEVVRAPRLTELSAIHYGTVGSGNQVIKHGRTRDRYAKQFDILCFEMEAAGLMDELPCIVIRGICDYCDVFKNKDFQEYAALTAAAYAKDLLLMMPVQQSARNRPPLEPLQDQNHIRSKQKRWDDLIASLTFDEANSRLDTVKRAHPQTCNWSLEQAQYKEWLNDEKAVDHHGLLWIRYVMASFAYL